MILFHFRSKSNSQPPSLSSLPVIEVGIYYQEQITDLMFHFSTAYNCEFFKINKLRITNFDKKLKCKKSTKDAKLENCNFFFKTCLNVFLFIWIIGNSDSVCNVIKFSLTRIYVQFREKEFTVNLPVIFIITLIKSIFIAKISSF